MGHSSNKAKQQWNRANYTQVKVSVRPEIATAFKAKCLDENISMASAISAFMSGQISDRQPKTKPRIDPYGTRQRRRKALLSIIVQLEAIMDAELMYMDNVPENLRGSQHFDNAEIAVAAFEIALDALQDAY